MTDETTDSEIGQPTPPRMAKPAFVLRDPPSEILAQCGLTLEQFYQAATDSVKDVLVGGDIPNDRPIPIVAVTLHSHAAMARGETRLQANGLWQTLEYERMPEAIQRERELAANAEKVRLSAMAPEEQAEYRRKEDAKTAGRRALMTHGMTEDQVLLLFPNLKALEAIP